MVVEAGVLPLDHHIVATEAILAAAIEVIMGVTTIHTLAQLSLLGTTDLRLDFTTGLITTITLMLITVLEPLKLLASLKMPSVSQMLQNVPKTHGSSLEFLLDSLEYFLQSFLYVAAVHRIVVELNAITKLM